MYLGARPHVLLMKKTFNNAIEFGNYIRDYQPLNIWWDVFSTDIPYITIDEYYDTQFRGEYTSQCFLTHELNKVESLFKEGFYVKIE